MHITTWEKIYNRWHYTLQAKDRPNIELVRRDTIPITVGKKEHRCYIWCEYIFLVCWYGCHDVHYGISLDWVGDVTMFYSHKNAVTKMQSQKQSKKQSQKCSHKNAVTKIQSHKGTSEWMTFQSSTVTNRGHKYSHTNAVTQMQSQMCCHKNARTQNVVTKNCNHKRQPLV